MMKFAKWVLAIAACLISGGVCAQTADAALVQQVSGEVTYAGAGAESRVLPFMKARSGDRFKLAAGARLSLVYIANGRQEIWNGPARFDIGTIESKALAGAAAGVTSLPVAVPQRIMKIPEMMQIAKIGGIQVRGIKPRQSIGPEQQAELAKARKLYAELRQRLPRADISPELYLFAVLQEQLMYDEMQRVLEDMRSAQPESMEVRNLADWMQERRKAGN